MYKILALLEKVHDDTLECINEKKYKNLSECRDLELICKQAEAAILIIEAFQSINKAKELSK